MEQTIVTMCCRAPWTDSNTWYERSRICIGRYWKGPDAKEPRLLGGFLTLWARADKFNVSSSYHNVNTCLLLLPTMSLFVLCLNVSDPFAWHQMDRVGERFPVEQEWSARVGVGISSTSSVGPQMRHPPPEPAAVNIPWPGPDFKLATVIPGSVYLWACGEPLQADGTSRVSRPQAAAAWIIIIVRIYLFQCNRFLRFAVMYKPGRCFPTVRTTTLFNNRVRKQAYPFQIPK